MSWPAAPAPPASAAGGAGASGAAVRKAALAAAAAFEREEAALTALDARAGDADLGISMVRGAKAIRELPEQRLATCRRPR